MKSLAGWILSVLFGLFMVVILILAFSAHIKCDHEEMGKSFSFSSPASTAHSNIKPYCLNCNNYFGYTLFDGVPEDKSYLTAMNNGEGFVDGEYYTLNAKVSVGDNNPTKQYPTVLLLMEKGSIRVSFSAAFKDEYKEALSISNLEKDSTITFTGKCVAGGTYWEDCYLVE